MIGLTSNKNIIVVAIVMIALVVPSAQAAVAAYDNTFTGMSSITGWYIFTGNATGTSPVVGYLSGAGPRWDWADNDDGFAQTALSTGDPLPLGGTITGDELLADGGLYVDITDPNEGDDRVAYNLAGTMETGEEITFSYNVFNHLDYYNRIQGQLWDLTDNRELAAGDWLTVENTGDVAYTPLDGLVSYTATASEAGHRLAIVFREWNNSAARNMYVDSISVTSSLYPRSRDSVDFDYKWEMDFSPWDFGTQFSDVDLDDNGDVDWVRSSSSHFVRDNGILTCISETSGSLLANDDNWSQAVWPVAEINSASGFTTEFRIRITEDTGTEGAFKVQLSPSDSTRTDVLYIGANHTTYYVDGGDDIVLDTSDNTIGFHTFRIIRYEGAMSTSIWRDGVLIGDQIAVTYTATPHRYYIGDVDSSVDGKFDMDYLRFTGGVYLPLPPACGDPDYQSLVGDSDEDGDMDLADFADLAASWSAVY